MKVLVGSRNPIKVAAVREAFAPYFPEPEVIGLAVSTGVSVQPRDDETFRGAENRAAALKALNATQQLNADFFVGLEGGITHVVQRWFAFGVVCIMDTRGRKAYGTPPFFELPRSVIDELLQGRANELGEVMDALIGERNTKEKQGSVGYFTRGVMTRKAYYVAGVTAALIPFLNEALYLAR